MYKANITITLRQSILDPEGKAIEQALGSMIEGALSNVRVGKHIELFVNADSREKAHELVENACKKMLANPVMEDYTFTLEEAETVSA
ncbi:MAG: phosphoribosylformylglycinamidine synthase [Ectothiorhodospiraceae bacterium]|nr:phosphoribosylformylglycinamidine synthase [Ectothiorhodospiraceae bacterium]